MRTPRHRFKVHASIEDQGITLRNAALLCSLSVREAGAKGRSERHSAFKRAVGSKRMRRNALQGIPVRL